jgi:glutamine transport system permease protein
MRCRDTAGWQTNGEVYIWIIRGTPLVVQALYVYFVVPAIIAQIIGGRYTLASTAAGIIVISLNSGRSSPRL